MDASHGHPRPQLRRPWTSLNGTWEFAIDPHGHWSVPDDVPWHERIAVPFSPETEASGIADTGFYQACWYRRRFEAPARVAGDRLHVHFGAVDYAAVVWIDGARAGHHVGGYTPFTIDVTDYLTGEGSHEIVVRAEDDPADLGKPRGKQDWLLEPHSIWYHRTTGIWQTVWMEYVPSTWIGTVRWTPSLARWELGFEARVDGDRHEGLRLGVKLYVGRTLVSDDSYTVMSGEVHRRIALSDPGIDDFRNGLLWSPESPTLIDAQLTLWARNGTLIDAVHSYTALRSIAVQGDRVVLNGRPYTLRMVLDQGYWNDTGLTAPDDDALRRDVEMTKAMGFNGVRKHQKIEDPRYLYWADRLGLLVWEEMPSAYRFTSASVERVTREWVEVLTRDYSHPCIVAWVPFNESWGVPNLPDNAAERHYVQALYHLTKTLDPTRPVIGNDGWEAVATDIIGIHDYEDPERMARRYRADEVRPRLFRRERPGGRILVLGNDAAPEHPIILSEFGGIALAANETTTWGYSRADTAASLAEKYKTLMEVVWSLELFSGFCYTQFADTFQEANGLLYADRTPKFPLDEMFVATRGPRFIYEPPIDKPQPSA
jgi:beta-galactosidase/beta-glucuronidase